MGFLVVTPTYKSGSLSQGKIKSPLLFFSIVNKNESCQADLMNLLFFKLNKRLVLYLICLSSLNRYFSKMLSRSCHQTLIFLTICRNYIFCAKI